VHRGSSFVLFAGGCRRAWTGITLSLMALALLVPSLTATAIAQRVVPETPRVSPVPVPPGGGGVGGGAGLIAPQPMTPGGLPTLPTLPTLSPTVPAAPAAPAARIVRFRCEVAPQDESCRDPGAPDDGGGDDSQCDCKRDTCYTNAAGTRICEKAR